MKNFVLVFFVLLAGCQLDADKGINREKFTFKTGSDTQLFFKNVRQSYYDLEENKAAKFNIFRFKNRIQAPDKAIVNLAIVVNYLNDEAYLLLEPSEQLTELPILIVAKNDSSNISKEIILAEQNRESTLHFATDIYEALIAGNSFSVQIDTTSVPFLSTQEEKEAFRITVSDYFRLTRVY